MIQCMYGTKMEIHMAYQFTYTEWNNFPYAERTRILEELAQYKRGRRVRRTSGGSVVSELTMATQYTSLLETKF